MQNRLRFNILFGSLSEGKKVNKTNEKTLLLGSPVPGIYLRVKGIESIPPCYRCVFPIFMQMENKPPKLCFFLGLSCLYLGCVNEKWINRADNIVLLLILFQVP